jgi:hypothetical protein
MIAFGACIGSDQRFADYAEPGILRASQGEPLVLKRRDQDSIFAGYNSILDEAQELAGLDALVLLHEDTELRDPLFEEKIRQLFSDRLIGLAGAIGASGVTSLSWWEGDRHGRASWNGPLRGDGPRVDDFGTETADVDCVDGLLLVLSPWVVRNVRFDDRYFRGFHGYDIDFSFAVRHAGKRVVVSDFPLHHHDRMYLGFPDRLGFLKTNIRWRAKWGFDSKAMIPARLAWLTVQSKSSSVRRRLGRNG